MNEKQIKRLKSIAIIAAIIMGIIALAFGVSKYILSRQSQDKALNFNEYRVQTNEISFSPSDYTGGEVTVTIAPSILSAANSGKTGIDVMKIQYQVTELNSQTGVVENNWLDYTGPFNVDHNVKINTRLVTQGNTNSTLDMDFTGPVTEKDVTNIAVAKIGTTTYRTLAEAITAWNEMTAQEQQDKKIEMIANTSENITIPQNKTVIIDLCGFNINGKTAQTSVITVNGTLNIIDSGKTVQGTTTYGSVNSPDTTAIQVAATGTLTLGTNESATSGNEEVVNTNGPAINGGTSSNGVVVAQNGTLNFYDGKITAPTAVNHTAIVVNSTPVGESDIDKVTTPNGYRLSIEVDSVNGREVATLIKTLTVSFDSNGGTPSNIASIEAAEGKAYGTYATWPSDPTREGYTFGGWNGKNLLDSQSFIENTNIACDVDGKLYAINKTSDPSGWSYDNSQYKFTLSSGTYTVSLKISKPTDNSYARFRLFKEDGTWITDRLLQNQEEITHTFSLSEETNIGLKVKLYDAEAYIQIEEGSTATEYEPYIVTSSTTVTQTTDHTLTAIWTPNTYNITYNLSNGALPQGTTNPTTYTPETETFTLNNPTRTGYTFKGWQENQTNIVYKGRGGNESNSPSTEVTINNNIFTFTKNDDGNNRFNQYKMQISGVNEFARGASIQKYTGQYTYNGETGNKILRFGANGTNKDATVLYDIYLEQGTTYNYEFEIVSISESEIVVKDIRFYKQNQANINLPPETIAKGSYGDRTYTAIFADETAPTDTAPTATATTSTITITCNQTDDGSGIDTTTIEYSIYKDGAWTAWQSTPTFDQLTANTEYQIKTHAKDNDGNGYTESQTGTITTQTIQNATTTIHKDTATGEVITSQTEIINNDTLVLTIQPTPTQGALTVVTITAPDVTNTTYALGTDVTLDPNDNTYHITIPNTATGTYSITTVTSDGTNTATDTQSVQIDRTNPVIAETITTTTNSVNAAANATDADSGVNTVTYELLESDGTTPAQDAQNQTVASNTTGIFTGLKDNHNYKLKITVTDNAGNTATKTINANTLELVLGTLTFKEASESTNFTPNTSDPNAQGAQVSKIWKNDNIQVTIATQGNGTTTYTYQKVGGTESAAQTSTSTITTENGDYVVTVISTDTVNTKTQSYYFSIDKTAPTVAMSPNTADIELAQGASTASVGTTLTITEDANASGIAEVKWAISNDNVNAPQTGWTTETPAATISVSATEGVGTYYIWAEVTDNAGNVSTTVKTSGAFTVKYVVEFDMNIDKTAEEIIIADTIKTTSSTITLPAAPTRNGYIFKGWVLDEDETDVTNAYAPGASYTVTSSTRFYALWSEVVASTTIGNNEPVLFDTVQGAIDYADSSAATVTLLKSEITENVSVINGQNITLDTNGKTLTSATNTVSNTGTLKITGTGTIQSTSQERSTINNNGILEVLSGTVKGTKAAINNAGTSTDVNAPSVKISGGNIQSTSAYTICNTSTGNVIVNAGSITGASGIKNDEQSTGTIIINGGSIKTTSHGIRNYIGNVEFNNGNIQTGLYGDGIWTSSTGNVSVTGGTITGGTNGVVTTGTGRITITGGTIEAKSTSNAGNAVNSHGKLTIGNNNDANIATTQTPVLIGSRKGVVNTGSEFNFYDGIIKAPAGQTINGTVTSKPEGYRVINGTELIDETTYETAYLDNHYTVTYDYDIATSGNTDVSKTVTYGQAYGTLPTPSKTGYTFSGWEYKFKNVNWTLNAGENNNYYFYEIMHGGVKAGATYTLNIESAELLEGTATEFNVIIYDFTTSRTIKPENVSFGNNIQIELKCPETADSSHNLKLLVYAGKSGKTAGNRVRFTNMSLSTDELGKITGNDIVTVATDHTIKAIWTPNIYKVTLNNQGADTAGTAEYYYQYNTRTGNDIYYTTRELTISLYDSSKSGSYITTPTKAGYIFNGYYTQTNGQGTQYVDGAGHMVNTIFSTRAEDTTLYAYWTPKSYNLMKVSEENNIIDNGSFEGYRIVDAERKKASNDTYHTWDKTLNGIPGDTEHAYSVTRWGTGNNSGVDVPEIGYHAHMRIVDGNAVFRFKTNEDYAGITQADVSDGVSLVNGTVTTGRWLGFSQTITGSRITAGKTYVITLDAYRVSGTNKITGGLYYANTSSGTSKSFRSGQFSFTPTQTGTWETFSWTFTVKDDYSYASVNPSLYIYGNQGGTGEVLVDNVRLQEVTSIEKAYDSQYTSAELAQPTRAGYTFQGWYKDPAYTTAISTSDNFNTTTATFDNVNTAGTNAYIYAKWTPNTNTSYTVNYYVHDIGATTYTLDSTDTLTGTTDAPVTMASLAKTITGHTFEAGYITGNTTKPSSGEVITATIDGDGSTVINMYYRPNLLYIRYDMNGGSLANQHGVNIGTSGSLITNDQNATDTDFLLGFYGSYVGVVNKSTYTVASDGLSKPHNTGYINIQKTGYIARTYAE